MTLERGRIGASSRNVPCRNAATLARHVFPLLGRDAVDFRQRHDAVANAQKSEDIEVFARLGHHAVVGGHDQDHAVHAGWRRRPWS